MEMNSLEVTIPKLFSNFQEMVTRRQKIKRLLAPIKRAVKWLVRK